MWCGNLLSPQFGQSTGAARRNAWCDRRMSRFERETFFLGTAMLCPSRQSALGMRQLPETRPRGKPARAAILTMAMGAPRKNGG